MSRQLYHRESVSPSQRGWMLVLRTTLRSAAIKVTVPRTAGDSPLKLKVKFQACNEETCLMPATVELTVP